MEQTIAIVIAIYLFPWMVAMARRSEDALMIFMVNLLLGWTLLFWVIALALAVRSAPSDKP